MKIASQEEIQTPRYKNFDGLIFRDKMLVAQFGPVAFPDWDDRTESYSQKYRLFRYVLQIVKTKGYSAAVDPEEKTVLFQCLLESLQAGKGTTFRLLGEVIEAVWEGLHHHFYYHDFMILLLATKMPENWQKDPELRCLWGDDLYPTNADVLKLMGKYPTDPSAQRSLARAKKVLDIDLPSAAPGRPKKKKKG